MGRHKLDALIFHELSHHFGTEDDDSEGTLFNAHVLDDLFEQNKRRFSSLIIARPQSVLNAPGFMKPARPERN